MVLLGEPTAAFKKYGQDKDLAGQGVPQKNRPGIFQSLLWNMDEHGTFYG